MNGWRALSICFLAMVLVGCGKRKADEEKAKVLEASQEMLEPDGPLTVRGINFTVETEDGRPQLISAVRAGRWYQIREAFPAADSCEIDLYFDFAGERSPTNPDPLLKRIELKVGFWTTLDEHKYENPNEYYGTVSEGDNVLVKKGKVFVNGEQRQARPDSERESVIEGHFQFPGGRSGENLETLYQVPVGDRDLSNAYEEVEEGMSLAEVESLLGEGAEVWPHIYVWKFVGASTDSYSQMVTVRFSEEKLVSKNKRQLRKIKTRTSGQDD